MRLRNLAYSTRSPFATRVWHSILLASAMAACGQPESPTPADGAPTSPSTVAPDSSLPDPQVTLLGFASFEEAAAFFGSTCGVTGCHANRYPPSLSNADLAVLRTSLEMYPVPRCGNLPLVEAGNPEASALPVLLRGECTDYFAMPFGCFASDQPPCLPPADIEKVRLWISNPDPFL